MVHLRPILREAHHVPTNVRPTERVLSRVLVQASTSSACVEPTFIAAPSAMPALGRARSCIQTVAALAFTLVVAPGCLQRLVNQRFPPLDTQKLVEAAVSESVKNLQEMDRRDLVASVSPTTMNKFIPPIVTNAFPQVKDVQLSVHSQEIRASLAFSGLFPIEFPDRLFSIQLAGKLTVAATAYVDSTKRVLRFRPWLCNSDRACQVVLTDLDLMGLKGYESDVLAKAIEAAIRVFADNINGLIEEQEVAFDTPILTDVDPAEAIDETTLDFFDAPTISFGTRIEDGAVLIDGEGIHVVAKLGDVTSRSPAPTPFAIEETVPRFDEYRARFRQLVRQDFGEEVEAMLAESSVFATKQFVAGLFNVTLDRTISAD